MGSVGGGGGCAAPLTREQQMGSMGWTELRIGFQTFSKGQISVGRPWKKHLDFLRDSRLRQFQGPEYEVLQSSKASNSLPHRSE